MGVLRGIHILAAASTLDGTSWIVSRSRGFTLHRDHSTCNFSRRWTEKMTTWKSRGGPNDGYRTRGAPAIASLVRVSERCIGHSETQIVVGFKCS